ncbi:deoxyhypusine synthase family protein [archaeon]|jgi:deoxyhypusine synthase|nr:deoxyhypusine synthase family protein [archaeon]MBT7128389.1 deoxyhypusine synthase family protein [archaeon]
MKKIKDFQYKPDMTVTELVDSFGSLGYQSIELHEATKIFLKMKRENCKIFLTFTSNMVTSGLRGLFAQLCSLKIPNILVTTSGSIEEDIMKSLGAEFEVSSFNADDTALHESGENRIGNITIKTEAYMKFEDKVSEYLDKVYQEKKRVSSSELLHEIGLQIKDENSILHQTAKNNIPIYCPGIADSSFGFQLYMFQEKHPDFIVDTVFDMKRITEDLSFDEKKGLVSLGGSISKHYAIFASLLSGGLDYAVYLTTSHATSGSMSGATTQEAKSWGKIKDDGQAATVNGDVCITFPLMITSALDKMREEGLLK